MIQMFLMSSVVCFRCQSWKKFGAVTRSVQRSLSTSVYVNDEKLAELYGFPFLSQAPSITENSFLLQRNPTNKHLEIVRLKQSPNNKETPFSIDFTTKPWNNRRKQAPSEVVVKAIGKANIVVDCTGGVGRDAVILASAGKSVIVVEQSKVLYLLLKDAFHRLRQHSPNYAQKLHLLHGDATKMHGEIQAKIDDILKPKSPSNTTTPTPHTISVYLDPMYPEDPAQRKAKVKKETQYLHLFANPLLTAEAPIQPQGKFLVDDNAMRALFLTGMKFATNRIVVKRGMHTPLLLPELTPNTTVNGQRQRFDIYFNSKR